MSDELKVGDRVDVAGFTTGRIVGFRDDGKAIVETVTDLGRTVREFWPIHRLTLIEDDAA